MGDGMTTKLVRVCLLGCLFMFLSRAVDATTAVQFVSTDGNNANNGLTWTTPVATIAQAITNLPAEGGVVWMASFTSTPYSLGTLDPGSKSVTLYLGCSPSGTASYTAQQIVLRENFHLIGCGSNSTNGTIITSTSATLPLVALGGTAPIAGVLLRGFRLEGAAGNSADGIQISAQANGGGLWYSTLEDIQIGVGTKFQGVALNFLGTAGGTPAGVNQFINIRGVAAFRNATSSYACQWLGSNGQFVIDNLECDGTSESGTTNINIASSSGSLYPYSLSFNELTTQTANLAVNISGGVSITFHQAHLEQINQGFLLSLGTGGVNTYNVNIEDSELAATFANGGSGFIAKTTTGPVNSNLNFVHNRVPATPDAFFVGFTTNLTEVGTMLSSGVYRSSTLQGLTVDGNLLVTGTKSASVSLPDGRRVAYYAVESPENWFEDFGTGQLRKGTAVVKLDPDFIKAVNSDMKYSVYITPDGPCGDLYVSEKAPTQFEIRQVGHLACNADFDYRIVARRRGFEKIRMEEVKPTVQ
jgi:hypothetical protein